MFKIRKLQTPIAPPANPIGRKLSDFIPNAPIVSRHEWAAQPSGPYPSGRSTEDGFDLNGDGKADVTLSRSYSVKDPQKLVLEMVMVNAPGKSYFLAGGEAYSDENQDGIVDSYSKRIPGADDKATGETWFEDTNFDGKADVVGRWGSEIDAAGVTDRFVGVKREDLHVHEQTDRNFDGLLDDETLTNPFIR